MLYRYCRYYNTDNTDDTDDTVYAVYTDNTIHTLARHTRFMLLSIFSVYSLHTATLSVHFVQLYSPLQTTLKNTHYINTNICTHICRYTDNTVDTVYTDNIVIHLQHLPCSSSCLYLLFVHSIQQHYLLT